MSIAFHFSAPTSRRIVGRRAALLACLAAVLLGIRAGAQPSPAPGRHAMHLIKLPNGDYTVPLSALAGSGTSGKVMLHPQGLKTIVTVYAFGNSRHRHAFTLHSGRDCAWAGRANDVALAPALTGQRSRTILSVPIGALTSRDYVIAANDATAKRQFQEACARL